MWVIQVQIFRARTTDVGKRRGIVLWGSGTVGHAVEQALLRRGSERTLHLPMLWHQPDSLQQSIDCAADVGAPKQFDEVHHIYAAGSAGFSAGSSETERELGVFNRVLEGLIDHKTPPDLQFHLISSAGGLFEGTVGVDASSEPAPIRAYGELKLRQEELLIAKLGEQNSHIYRLSSVYGAPHPHRRRSLIGNLLLNSFAHRVTRVTGKLDTLRDYIHSDDAAAFVVDRALTDARSNLCRTVLASGRSTSILEVLRIVEQLTRRKPFVELAPENNSASVSFLPSALPDGFAPADLRTRIGAMLKNMTG